MSKSTPPAPDYQKLAESQGAANKETAIAQAMLNNPNQTNPYGTRTWSTTPDANGRYTVDDTLSPEEQQKQDMQNALQKLMLEGATQYGIPNAINALNTNFTPPREAQLGWENDYSPDQRLQTESGMYEAPWIQEGVDFSKSPALQSKYDLSGVQGIPQADQETRRRMEQSVYDMGNRYLEPQFQKAGNALDNKLSNQGIFVGSDAYKDSQDLLADQKNKAFADLRDQAIQGGGAEMERQFGLGLQAHNTGFADAGNMANFNNAARQQGNQDVLAQGTFANSARGQLISELQADMQNRNAAITGQANVATGQQGASNTGTQAWLAQKAQAVNMPINTLTALMSGSQVNNPQWQPYNNNISYAPPPIFEAGKAQYGAAMQGYNAQQAGTQNLTSAATAVGTAAMFM